MSDNSGVPTAAKTPNWFLLRMRSRHAVSQAMGLSPLGGGDDWLDRYAKSPGLALACELNSQLSFLEEAEVKTGTYPIDQGWKIHSIALDYATILTHIYPDLPPIPDPASHPRTAIQQLLGWAEAASRSHRCAPPPAVCIQALDLLLKRLRVECWDGDGTTDDGPRETPTTDSDEAPPALTPNQTVVIETMAQFDGSRLLSAVTIDEGMDPKRRLSARTIGPIVRRLIKLGLAERPEGERSGARLTPKGRRLAPKIAD